MNDIKIINVPEWNLSDLYSSANDPKIEKDLKIWLKRAKNFQKRYKEKINSPSLKTNELYEAISEFERIAEQSSKPETFASLMFAAETNEKNGAFMQKIETATMEIEKNLIFFRLELAELPETAIKKFIKSPELKKYAHFIKFIYSFKKHHLSDPEEKIIQEKNLTGSSAFARLFEEITSNSSFDVIAKNIRRRRIRLRRKKQKLNESQTLALLYSPDRELRKSAADALSEGLKQNARLYTFIYNTLVFDKSLDDRLRKYQYPESSRHMANEISKDVVDTITKVCEKNYQIVSDYYRLKQKILGYKNMFDYDRYAPISENIKQISFDESKNIILESFNSFSESMKNTAEKFFTNNWIDAKAKNGKRGGAFCSYVGTDTHPYVFMNFLGKTRDVMTLGHELGHGVHAYLAKNNGYLSFHTPLTLAETASVFGEMLVFDHLMQSAENKKEKLTLLCGKIEDIISTIFRQITMYKFESEIHDHRKNGEFSMEQACEFWMKNNQAMFGKSLKLSENYKYWWMYIPHFINTPFYVYSYAFGELLTLSLYARWKKEGTEFNEKYVKFLSAGGSEEPAKLLSRLNVDISKPSFWTEGIQVIKEMLEEAKRLA